MKPHTLRVLHFITALDYSGAPKGVLELIRLQLACAEVEPQLATLQGTDQEVELPDQLDDVFTLDTVFSIRRPLQAWRAARRLREHLRSQNINIIHSHLPSADAVAALAVIGTNVRHVSHIRSTPPWLSSTSGRNAFKRFIFRSCFNLAGTTFASVSRNAADYYNACLLGDTTTVNVVVNGVDCSEFGPDDPFRDSTEVLIVGAAGRFSREKDFESLISAIGKLKRQGRKLKLRIAGTGGLKDQYVAVARKAGIEDQLELCGVVEDIYDFYRAIDLFVLPSLSSEGLPRVLIEAGASGIPVIATDVGGAKELVIHGETGILVPPNNVDALAEAIENLAMNHPFRDQMRRAARARVLSEFSSIRVEKELRAIYDRVQ